MILNHISCCDNVGGLRALPENCIDLTVTSPPYDNLRDYKGFSWDFEALAQELYRVTKPGGVVVWVVNDATVDGSETGSSFRQALFFKEIGFNIHDTMIWDKGGFTATGSLAVRYGPVFEYMFIFSKGKPKTFNPIKDRENKNKTGSFHKVIRQKDGTTKASGHVARGEYGQRFNIWRMSGVCPKERTGHPAQYPIELVKDHVISWSNPGDVVLDPFMGSGTTAVACLRTGRNYIGYEISPEYCALARNRIDAEAPGDDDTWML